MTRRVVDELVADLFGPLLRPEPWGSVSLVSWDAEQGPCITLRRDDALLLVELEGRDEKRPCYARTGRFNVVARRQLEVGRALEPEDRRIVDLVVEVVSKREARLPSFDRPTTSRPKAVRELEVDHLLIPEGAGHYYLNPYVGCAIGCPFCYVAERADLSRSLEGLPRLPWGRYVDVKVNAPEVLRKEIDGARPGVVRMSPILTDPYQPAERNHRVTRGCLEVLLGTGFVPALLTRAARVVEDISLLRRFEAACVGFSIPTDDDRMRRLFEPGADPIDERFDALERCHAAGLRTVALVQPMLPMNESALVDRLAPLVDAVRIDRMQELDSVRSVYERAGLEDAATEAFFSALKACLEAAFRKRGVAVDEMDDLAWLLDARRERVEK